MARKKKHRKSRKSGSSSDRSSSSKSKPEKSSSGNGEVLCAEFMPTVWREGSDIQRERFTDVMDRVNDWWQKDGSGKSVVSMETIFYSATPRSCDPSCVASRAADGVRVWYREGTGKDEHLDGFGFKDYYPRKVDDDIYETVPEVVNRIEQDQRGDDAIPGSIITVESLNTGQQNPDDDPAMYQQFKDGDIVALMHVWIIRIFFAVGQPDKRKLNIYDVIPKEVEYNTFESLDTLQHRASVWANSVKPVKIYNCQTLHTKGIRYTPKNRRTQRTEKEKDLLLKIIRIAYVPSTSSGDGKPDKNSKPKDSKKQRSKDSAKRSKDGSKRSKGSSRRSKGCMTRSKDRKKRSKDRSKRSKDSGKRSNDSSKQLSNFYLRCKNIMPLVKKGDNEELITKRTKMAVRIFTGNLKPENIISIESNTVDYHPEEGVDLAEKAVPDAHQIFDDLDTRILPLYRCYYKSDHQLQRCHGQKTRIKYEHICALS